MVSMRDKDQYDTHNFHREYHTRLFEVKARDVQKGDNVSYGVCHTNKTGTKWSEIRDENGKLLLRVQADYLVSVERQVETEESRLARRRMDKMWAIAHELERHKLELEDAVHKFAAKVDEQGRFDYQPIGDILEAQARDRVWREFDRRVTAIDELENDERDLLDVLEEFKQDQRETLSSIYANRAISRSTNQLSNLMDDCLLEARAAFVNNTHYYF